MSAICGIYNFGGKGCDSAALQRMGKAMFLRGREQSGGYLNGNVGLLHNRMIFSGTHKDRQPLGGLSLRGEKNIILAFDGEITNLASLSGLLFLPPFTSSAEAVLECYKTFGIAACEHLDGAFALAVFDEERKEIILMRDEKGKKPLYYSTVQDEFVFASEISGLMAYYESGLKVDTEMLERQMREPYERISAGRIFPEIEELREGSYAVYSRLGFENFSYTKGYIAEDGTRKAHNIRLFPPLTEKSVTKGALLELLRAYGHPFFNYHTLQLLDFAKQERASGRRVISAAYEDVMFAIDEKLSFDAADRIGMLYGLMCYPNPPEQGDTSRRRDLKRVEKKLCEMTAKLYEKHGGVFNNPAAEAVYKSALTEKEPLKKIGMLGMIIQGEYWAEQSNIVFI